MDMAREEMQNGFLPDVAKKITIDWKMLGRKLGIPHAELEAIDDEERKTEEKAYRTLIKWYQHLGHLKATKEVLKKALRDIGRTSTVLELEHHETHEETNQHDNNNNVPRQETPTVTKDTKTTPLTRTTSNDPRGERLRILQMELSSTLKNCQDGIETCRSAELVGRQRILQNVHNIYRTVDDMIADYEDITQDATKVALIKKLKSEQREKISQVDQTIRLIQSMLEQPQKVRRTRTTSETPKRCTSYVDLQVLQKCSTCPESSRPVISYPIITRQLSTLERGNGRKCSTQHKHDNENAIKPRIVEQDDYTECCQHNRISNLETTSQSNVAKQDNSHACCQHKPSNAGTISPTNATQSFVEEQDDCTQCSRHNRSNMEMLSSTSTTQSRIKERDDDTNNGETWKNVDCEETHEDSANKEILNSKL